jgi:hypothetical protein
MSIRRATKQDEKEIFAACKSEAEARYPHMRVDVESLAQGVRMVVRDRAHFAWVSEDKTGRFAGALLAITGDNLWAQRKFSNVVFWQCRKAGDGAALLRQLRAWVKAGRAIRIAGLLPDCDIDPRVFELAKRIGFKEQGHAFILVN